MFSYDFRLQKTLICAKQCDTLVSEAAFNPVNAMAANAFSVLLASLAIRNRKCEVGVLRAMGMKKFGAFWRRAATHGDCAGVGA